MKNANKLEKVNLKNLNSKGGVDVIIRHITKRHIPEKIDRLLGKRNARAEFKYSDVVLTWFYNVMAGAKRLEHVYSNQRMLKNNPFFTAKSMSPDTISKVIKELSVKNIYMHGKTEKLLFDYKSGNPIYTHEININEKMNCFILDLCISLGLFNSYDAYELDIDATIVNTKNSDSRPHYKHANGYSPLVVIFGGIPIYMENRNGNTPARYRVVQVLHQALTMIKERGLSVKCIRSDAAMSTLEGLQFLHDLKLPYYIRAYKTSSNMHDGIDWEDVNHKSRKFKFIVSMTRMKNAKHDVRLVTYHAYGAKKAFGIYTNDEDISKTKAMDLYNRRGAIEQRFSLLKELGWKYMSQRNLCYNTVYMQMTMVVYALFLYMKKHLAPKMHKVKETMELLTFIMAFIEVATIWMGESIRFLTRTDEYRRLVKETG